MISAAALCQPLPVQWTILEFSEELQVLCLEGGAGAKIPDPSRESLYLSLLRACLSMSPQRNKAQAPPAGGGEPDDQGEHFPPISEEAGGPSHFLQMALL